jgi:CBS-domain-containing membrane protein
MRSFIHHGFRYLERKDYAKALELFQSHGISLIPVLDQSLALKDVITLTDMLGQVDLKAGA